MTTSTSSTTFFGAGTPVASSSFGRKLDDKTQSRLGRCGTKTRRRHHPCRVTDSFAMFSNSRNDVSREKSDEEETVYRLRFTGSDAGMEVPAISLRKGDTWTVGRVKKLFSMDAKNFIELKVPSVSTRHAQVSRDMNGNVYVTDLKSKNGTYVNGIEIYKKTKIILRDDVVFGDATFRLEDATSRNPLSAVSSGAKKLFKEAQKLSADETQKERLSAVSLTAKKYSSAVGSGAKKLFEEAQKLRAEQIQKERQIENAEEAAANARSVEAQLVPIEENEEEEKNAEEDEVDMRVILGPIGDWANGPVVDLDVDESLILGSGKRKGDCDVIVPNVETVDSKHCMIFRDGGGVYVKDLGSQYGTWIENIRCKEDLLYRVAPGQNVRLGDVAQFQFSALKADEEYIAPVHGIDASQAKMIISDADLRRDEIITSGDDADAPTAWSAITAASTNEDGGGGGGIKGLGDAIGAAIFNSKININYQYKPNVNVGNAGKTGPAELKAALFVELADTQRGLKADKGKRRKIEQILRALEAKNPTRSPLKSPLMNGRWALQYTTELNAVGKNRPGFLRPQGAIYQTVDVFSQTVLNEQTYSPLPFVSFKSRNVSELDAQTESRAKVKKQEYMFAGLKLKAPPKTPGRQIADWEMEASGLGSMAWMDTTFVDNDLRISRTQAGAVFVFSRNDPNDDDVNNY